MIGIWDAQTNECMNLILPWWRKAKAMSVQDQVSIDGSTLLYCFVLQSMQLASNV